MNNITITATASQDGLRAVTAVHDLGAGWPELGAILTTEILIDCARRAGERGGVLMLNIIGDGEPARQAW